MTSLSSEQQECLNKMKKPANWEDQPYEYYANPLPYYASYVSPAWHANNHPVFESPLSVNFHPVGIPIIGKFHNQFTSAVTQRQGNPALPFEYHPGYQYGAGIKEKIVNIGKKIKGVWDEGKRFHSLIKKHQIGSKNLHFLAEYKPGLKKYAEAAEKIGYGKKKQKGGCAIGKCPQSYGLFNTMPVKPKKI